MEKRKFKTIDLVYIGVSAALIAICSWISIPIGAIPITLQTMAVCLIAGLLGTKRGTLSVFVYILLGAIGVPVFSGFKGGLGALSGATGGYIIGFIFTALIIGFVSDKTNKLWLLIDAMVTGILVCYAFGTVWFIIIYTKTGEITLAKTLSLCVLPFIPFDAIKILIASILVNRLKRFVK